MFWFFGSEACGILAPQPGIRPAPIALEGHVWTTGPPGKSFCGLFLSDNSLSQVELLNKYLGTCSGLQFELWPLPVIAEHKSPPGQSGRRHVEGG